MRSLMKPTGVQTFRNQMDRLFDNLFEDGWKELPAVGDWSPSMDVSETKDAVIVKAEVPGMESTDIEVSMQENLLTIKGEKKEEKEEKNERYHRTERSYGMFTRTVQVPMSVDASAVTAAFKNGLLTVTLPKAPSAKAVPIAVKAG